MRLAGTAAVITALALLAFVSEVLQHKPELSWHVRSEHRALNGWFSMTSCRLVRALTPQRS